MFRKCVFLQWSSSLQLFRYGCVNDCCSVIFILSRLYEHSYRMCLLAQWKNYNILENEDCSNCHANYISITGNVMKRQSASCHNSKLRFSVLALTPMKAFLFCACAIRTKLSRLPVYVVIKVEPSLPPNQLCRVCLPVLAAKFLAVTLYPRLYAVRQIRESEMSFRDKELKIRFSPGHVELVEVRPVLMLHPLHLDFTLVSDAIVSQLCIMHQIICKLLLLQWCYKVFFAHALKCSITCFIHIQLFISFMYSV